MSYKFTKKEVRLPNHDADVKIVLSNGTSIYLQWRTESPSLDVCFHEKTTVTVWKDTDMTPARLNKHGFTEAMQLVFSFNELVLEEK